MKNRATQTVVTRQLNILMIYTLCVTIALIVVSVNFTKHECPKPEPVDQYRQKIQTLQLKIKDYENKKVQNVVDLINLSDSERDSLRATINPR